MKDISRRRFLCSSTGFSLGLGLARNLNTQDWITSHPGALSRESTNDPQAPSAPSTLAGTTPLTMTGDLASQMVDGIHQLSLAPDPRGGSRTRATVAAGLSLGRGLQSLRLAQPRALSPDHRRSGPTGCRPRSRTGGNHLGARPGFAGVRLQSLCRTVAGLRSSGCRL